MTREDEDQISWKELKGCKKTFVVKKLYLVQYREELTGYLLEFWRGHLEVSSCGFCSKEDWWQKCRSHLFWCCSFSFKVWTLEITGWTSGNQRSCSSTTIMNSGLGCSLVLRFELWRSLVEHLGTRGVVQVQQSWRVDYVLYGQKVRDHGGSCCNLGSVEKEWSNLLQ